MAILLSEAPLRLFKLLLGLGWVEAGERQGNGENASYSRTAEKRSSRKPRECKSRVELQTNGMLSTLNLLYRSLGDSLNPLDSYGSSSSTIK